LGNNIGQDAAVVVNMGHRLHIANRLGFLWSQSPLLSLKPQRLAPSIQSTGLTVRLQQAHKRATSRTFPPFSDNSTEKPKESIESFASITSYNMASQDNHPLQGEKLASSDHLTHF
jgi:hypothetical protein